MHFIVACGEAVKLGLEYLYQLLPAGKVRHDMKLVTIRQTSPNFFFIPVKLNVSVTIDRQAVVRELESPRIYANRETERHKNGCCNKLHFTGIRRVRKAWRFYSSDRDLHTLKAENQLYAYDKSS